MGIFFSLWTFQFSSGLSIFRFVVFCERLGLWRIWECLDIFSVFLLEFLRVGSSSYRPINGSRAYFLRKLHRLHSINLISWENL